MSDSLRTTASARDFLTPVIENALDYLERAAAQCEAEPKYSVINFCAGMELLLKVRLLAEHWTLILEEPGKVSLADFTQGRFKSVTVNETMRRLTNAALGVSFARK